MKITVVTTMRDEGPFVLEWLAHMRALGVSDVLVYSNDCADGSDVLLDLLAQQGFVTHIRQTLADGENPQWTALNAAWDHPTVKSADWVMVCDVDEFPDVKIADGTFPGLIAHMGDVDAITFPWRLFGSAGKVRFQDIAVTQQFTKCAAVDAQFPIATTMFKTLFRLSGKIDGLGVHRPKQSAPFAWLDGSGCLLPDDFSVAAKRIALAGSPVGRDWVELRHYSLKSIGAFLVKRMRGLPNHTSKPIDLAYWVNRNFNDAVVAPLNVGQMDWPNAIQSAHDACVMWYHRQIDAALADPVTYDLYSNLILAGSSRRVAGDAARHLYQLYQATQTKRT